MAEHFLLPGDERVHFSNGAVEALYAAWSRLAETRLTERGMAAVGAELRGRLERGGAGGRAFGLTPATLPEGLQGRDRLEALAALIRLCLEDVTVIAGVDWTPELAQSWRERLAQLLGAVEQLTLGF